MTLFFFLFLTLNSFYESNNLNLFVMTQNLKTSLFEEVVLFLPILSMLVGWPKNPDTL